MTVPPRSAATASPLYLLDNNAGVRLNPPVGLTFGGVVGIGTVSTSARVAGNPLAAEFFYPSAATSVAIASTNAADTAAGTGARAVTVTYLDDQFEVQTSDVRALSGTTPVTIQRGGVNATDVYRIQRIFVVSVGAGGENAGNLFVGDAADTFTSGVPTQPFNAVGIGLNNNRAAIYTVPANRVWVATQFVVSGTSSKVETYSLQSRPLSPGGVWFTLQRPPVAGPGLFDVPLSASPAQTTGSDLRILAVTDTGSATSSSIVSFYERDTRFLR